MGTLFPKQLVSTAYRSRLVKLLREILPDKSLMYFPEATTVSELSNLTNEAPLNTLVVSMLNSEAAVNKDEKPPSNPK